MPHVTVEPVTSWRQRRQFLLLPWDLHGSDPNWVPPLRGHQKEMVGFTHHPFYDDAARQAFLAYRDGKPAGRILAIVNHAHNRRYHEQRGFFGFFESVDDREVSRGLFDAARAWLQSQDMRSMRGPTNPSLNYECGLLIDGFDSPPTFMMTYNPAYYPALVEDYGFKKTQDLFAFGGHVDMLATLDKKLEFIINEAKQRFNIHVRPLDKRRFAEELQSFLSIYNQSLVDTWGFVPLSPSEAKHLAAGLRQLIVPELAIAAEVDGKMIGATFGMLDYNPRIKQIDGRLFPFGFIKLLTRRKELKRVRLISTNVLPEYQRWGVGLVIMGGLVPHVLEFGIEEGEFSWVLESNHLSRRTLEKGGAICNKTFRIYDCEF